MEFNEIFGYIISALGGGGVTQFFNWRINKKKGQVEVNASEIDNIKKSVEVYQTIIADQNKRINELNEEVRQLREDKRKMEETYQAQIATLQKQIVEINRVLGINARKAARDAKSGKFVKSGESEA